MKYFFVFLGVSILTIASWNLWAQKEQGKAQNEFEEDISADEAEKLLEDKVDDLQVDDLASTPTPIATAQHSEAKSFPKAQAAKKDEVIQGSAPLYPSKKK